MSQFKHCKNYFPHYEGASTGDYIRHESNAKQLYYTSKPVNENDSCDCCDPSAEKSSKGSSN